MRIPRSFKVPTRRPERTQDSRDRKSAACRSAHESLGSHEDRTSGGFAASTETPSHSDGGARIRTPAKTFPPDVRAPSRGGTPDCATAGDHGAQLKPVGSSFQLDHSRATRKHERARLATHQSPGAGRRALKTLLLLSPRNPPRLCRCSRSARGGVLEARPYGVFPTAFRSWKRAPTGSTGASPPAAPPPSRSSAASSHFPRLPLALPLYFFDAPEWRKGRRDGLKNRCPKDVRVRLSPRAPRMTRRPSGGNSAGAFLCNRRKGSIVKVRKEKPHSR